MSGVIGALGLLAGICARRLGPQDLPHSPALLRGLLLSVVGLQLLFAWVLGDALDAPGRLLFSLAMALAVPWLLLHWRGRRERYVQTMSALFGTDLLFGIAMLPLVWYVSGLPPPSATTPPTGPQALASLLALAMMGWKVAVVGHIWRHALDWPLLGGVLLALALFLFDIGLDQMLFGAPAR